MIDPDDLYEGAYILVQEVANEPAVMGIVDLSGETCDLSALSKAGVVLAQLTDKPEGELAIVPYTRILGIYPNPFRVQ